jgi:site-specific DNA-methyltransferase (cytosine-N4-specific)
MTLQPFQTTELGKLYVGHSEELLAGPLGDALKGKVQLIFTSPPFPLNKKKAYEHHQGEEYIQWLAAFAPIFSGLLTPTGSIVIELGNAWEPGKPVQSLLPLQSLLSFVQNKEANLVLCQEFICHNPARLPSPAQWVTIERIRVTDSYTHLWWMSQSDRPKANNKNVLRPYSKAARSMQQKGSFNAGKRPSGHLISEQAFLKDNGGSIMQNVLELDPIEPERETRLPSNAFSIAHTTSNDYYLRECKRRGTEPHPARMPLQLVDFFIRFLTDPGDLVLDPFAGSNATGFCAQQAGRSWISIEAEKNYTVHSLIRFSQWEEKSDVHQAHLNGNATDQQPLEDEQARNKKEV